MTRKDIGALVKAARVHGEFIDTHTGRIPIGVIAFFSNTYAPSTATCDGFFEYSLGADEVVKWTPDVTGEWHRRSVGAVRWLSKTRFQFEPRSDP